MKLAFEVSPLRSESGPDATEEVQDGKPMTDLPEQQDPVAGEYRLGKYLYLKSPRVSAFRLDASSTFAVLGRVDRKVSRNPSLEARGAHAICVPSFTGNGTG